MIFINSQVAGGCHGRCSPLYYPRMVAKVSFWLLGKSPGFIYHPMEMTKKFGAGAENLKSIFMEMTEGNDVPWIHMSYKLYIITKSP